MAESPVIESERLLIVPFSAIYLTERYVGWLNDPEVVRYSDQRHYRHTLQSCKAYWQSFAGTPNYFWAIVAPDLQQGHIGNMSAYVDPIHSVANLGIMIGEQAVRGQGYGSEAWIAVCGYLLREAGLRKVTAGAREVNTAMLGVMRHAGMVEDGRRVRECLFEGREVDKIYAALFREDLAREDERASRSQIGTDRN